MDKIIIIGGKGAAVNLGDHIVHAIKNYNAKYELIGYCIDDESLGTQINGIPILCKLNELTSIYNKFTDIKYFFALYKPTCMEQRVELFEKMNLPLSKFINFVHPSVYIAPSSKMGIGNVFCSQVIINNNTTIGNFNTFNGNCLFGHDSFIGDHNILAASCTVSSEVKIGNGNFLGINSSILDGVRIDDYNILGMSSTLLNNVDSRKKLVGTPARIIK
jgi:sugar O-acyltransferase (sialic acid O-acetyltransferase NeuD family)